MNAVTARTPAITSRLPRVGTTIFTVMSALATQHGAVNLGQGFPDFDCDPSLLDAVNQAMRAGPEPVPADGRRAGAARGGGAQDRARSTAARYDPGDEITITAGATQAILTAILAIVHPGDEVIVLEPCYDSYVPNIELAGGARGARAAHRRHLPARLRCHRRGHHAAHARDPRQHAAQPQRHRVDARRHASGWPNCCARPTCC